MPTVSVLIPCFNQGRYLPETLESLIAQTFSDWEALIVDDGSTDDSAAIAERFCARDKRFRLIRQDNAGVAAARNRAIAESRGQYLLPLDADDRIAPAYLEKAVAELDRDPEIRIVYGGAERFGGARQWELPSYSMERMLARNCIYVSALFRKEDAGEGFDPAFRDGYEDWDFWLSVLERHPGRVVKLPETVFYYRTHRDSRNFGVSDERLAGIRKLLWEKHRGLYGSYFFDPKESVEYLRLERAFKKASRFSLVWKLRLLARRLTGNSR